MLQKLVPHFYLVHRPWINAKVAGQLELHGVMTMTNILQMFKLFCYSFNLDCKHFMLTQLNLLLTAFQSLLIVRTWDHFLFKKTNSCESFEGSNDRCTIILLHFSKCSMYELYDWTHWILETCTVKHFSWKLICTAQTHCGCQTFL